MFLRMLLLLVPLLQMQTVAFQPPETTMFNDRPEVIEGMYEGTDGTLAWRLARPGQPAPEGGWPVLLFLHGCTQDAEDAAKGTALDLAATSQGWLVLYPEQTPDRHPLRCWNWYEPDTFGEVALLLSLLDDVASAHGGDLAQVSVAGMSAGGAMAMRLGRAMPERFLGVVSHSGVDPSLTETQLDALQRMQGIPSADPASGAIDLRGGLPPLLLIHGDQDEVVHPINLDWAADRWLMGLRGLTDSEPQPERTHLEPETVQDRSAMKTTWGEGMTTLKIQGLGHAWSGGDPAGTYTDPAGPQATRHLLAFLDALRIP